MNNKKFEAINAMAQTGIVAVYYESSSDVAISTLQACYDGGIRVFEFTNRGNFAHEIFRELARHCALHCQEMILGAGSVIDAPTAAIYLQMGARFIVGPSFNPEIARLCNRRQVPYIPGCGTVTEICTAQEAGCDVCKVFPGEVLGPRFVKAVKAPMPWTQLMVTGGVEPTEENISAWFKAGAMCVGMGSKLFNVNECSSDGKCLDYIMNKCRNALEIAAKAKNQF